MKANLKINDILEMIKAHKISSEEGYKLIKDNKLAPNISVFKCTETVVEKMTQEQVYIATENMLKQICSELFVLPKDKIDETVDFDEYGIDSVMVNEFNRELEKKIQGLPKTILFENKNIKTLSEYLCRNYTNELIKVLGLDTSMVHQKIVAPSLVQDGWQELDSFNTKEINNNYSGGMQVNNEDIAIIGLSGKYPKAIDLDEFWENMKNKKDCIALVPEERWDYRNYFDEDAQNVKPGKMYAVWAGFIDKIDRFDPLFFNISPMEAEIMDPQERLFLQSAWEVLEDAGYTRKQLRKFLDKEDSANVGVFVGTTSQTYQYWGIEEMMKGNPICPNASPWSLANRVSYIFNFSGPSMPVDTACSSGLTAVHLACESIKNGECSTAIVGGVNLFLHPYKFITMCQMRMLSPTGKCAAFGNDANGFVPGEGVGAVLLKPLSKAVKDNDQIYAVIKATGINHDGKTNGYTVPNLNAQNNLISDVIRKSGLDSRTISYLEAHGTGTKLGDPIEVAAASKAFGKETEDKQFCAIGSLKANIGHLEAAAGIASLTKVLLMLKYKKILPSIHSEIPNENIDFLNTPFYVPQEIQEWDRPSIAGKTYPRRAGISSFGAGGSNSHIIVEEYVNQSKEEIARGPYLFTLSAKNKERLQVYVIKLKEYILKHEDINLQSLACTLQVGREAMEERLAFAVHDRNELVRMLHQSAISYNNENNIFRNNVKKIKNITSNELVTENLNHLNDKSEFERLNAIADSWVKGKEIDWYALYASYLPKRISLPTYPFKEDTYYIHRTPSKLNEEVDAAAIEKIVAEKRGIVPDAVVDIKKAIDKREQIEEISFASKWIETPITPNGNFYKYNKILLVYTKTGQKLADAIESIHDNVSCIHLIIDDEKGLSSEFGVIDPAIDCIYFLGALQDKEYKLDDIYELERIQQQTNLSFFRLIKKMIDLNKLEEAMTIKVISNNIFGVEGMSKVKPFGAGLNGFLRGLVKEYPYTSANYIDLDQKELEEDALQLAKIIVDEQASADVVDIAIRAGKRYVRKLESIEVEKSVEMPLKEGGVYFIIGGLGSIGYEFAKYAIKQVNAKIVLVGRSNLTQESKVRINKIGKLGEQIIYLQADCTDELSLNQAIQATKAKWGGITGVIHSAMVFNPQLLRKLDEESFCQTLESKVKGTVVLSRVLQKETIDFMLYFSSGQAFTGNKQRIHYSTACTFTEAFIEALRYSAPYEINVINWGFWGTDKGEKISVDYENFLEKRGIKAISAELGMEIVKRVLAHNMKQVVVFTVNDTVLEMMGVTRKNILPELVTLEYKDCKLTEESKDNLKITGLETTQMSTSIDELKAQVQAKITSCIVDVLKVTNEDVDTQVPFMELGVDSIIGTKMVHKINEELGTEIAETSLFDYSTVDSLSEFIVNRYVDVLMERNIAQEEIACIDEKIETDEDSILSLFKKLEENKIDVDDISQLLEV